MTMPEPWTRKATVRRVWPSLRWRTAGPRPARSWPMPESRRRGREDCGGGCEARQASLHNDCGPAVVAKESAAKSATSGTPSVAGAVEMTRAERRAAAVEATEKKRARASPPAAHNTWCCQRHRHNMGQEGGLGRRRNGRRCCCFRRRQGGCLARQGRQQGGAWSNVAERRTTRRCRANGSVANVEGRRLVSNDEVGATVGMTTNLAKADVPSAIGEKGRGKRPGESRQK